MKRIRIILLLSLLLSIQAHSQQKGFVGEIRMFSGNTAPIGWAFCEGQMLSISANPNLFTVIGTTYGGNGTTTFSLPDLRGRVAVGMGQGSGMTNRTLGEKGGEETHLLSIDEMPSHTHSTAINTPEHIRFSNISAVNENPTEGDVPAVANFGSGLGSTTVKSFGPPTTNNIVNGQSINNSIEILNEGGLQPHNNMQPWLSLRYIISVDGAFLNNNNGTLNQSEGANIYAGNENTVSGTIDKAYGIKVNIQKGNGIINNGYGLFIESIASDNAYGIYQNEATNKNFFSGSVGIGTTNPGIWKLAVNGKIRAKEIKVETGWSDFVFENNYKLPTLKEVENHIKEKGHLKDIPSAKEVAKNGIYLGEMDAKLLQKIEELTLYTILQEKRLNSVEFKNEKLEKENESLKFLATKFLELQKRLEKLEKK